MGSKRKAARGGASGTAKKAKARPSAEEFQAFYESTLKLVNNLQDENNERLLVTPFIKLPSKKIYPDYYTVIKNPITVGDIQRKLGRKKYSGENTGEFVADFKLLHDNATEYNDVDSWIAIDAKKIYEFVRDQAKQFVEDGRVGGEGEPDAKVGKQKNKKVVKSENGDVETSETEINVDKLYELAKNLLNEVIDHEFPELGVISGPFIDDIDRKEYPDYFKIVENPTSFSSILNKLKKKRLFSQKLSVLDNLEVFFQEGILIFSNAQLYNDPGSLIHQDSLKLEELFKEKYAKLKQRIELQGKLGNKLKLKLKPGKKETTPKVKINLKLKPDGSDSSVTDSTKKRRKKRKIVEEVSTKEELVDDAGENDITKDDIEDGEGNGVDEKPLKNDDEQGANIIDEAYDQSISTSSSSVMGKSTILIPSNEAFIQELSISSSMSKLTQLSLQYQQQVQNHLSDSLRRSDLIKYALFPKHIDIPTSTLFEYNFPATGYAYQTYSVCLPPNSAPFVSVKISLHTLLEEIQKSRFANGQGIANQNSDEEFQCKLFVNDDEVTSGADLADDESSSLLYDLKLSSGLNIINFECKVAPTLGKKIKKNLTIPESEESAGRYTRHQFQQMKMSWDVEKFSLMVVYSNL